MHRRRWIIVLLPCVWALLLVVLTGASWSAAASSLTGLDHTTLRTSLPATTIPGIAGESRPLSASETALTEDVRTAAAGDLSVLMLSPFSFAGVAPGTAVSYTVFYQWDGDGPAPNVRINVQIADGIDVDAANPTPTSQTGNALQWNLGTLDNHAHGTIVINGTVRDTIAFGTVLTSTAAINGDITEENVENNQAAVSITVQEPKPNLWLWKFGLFEELEQRAVFFQAERDVETSFEIYYFNFSNFEAPGTVLVDTLPPGTELVGAEPAPSSVDGNRLTWDLGTLAAYGFGQVTVRARPTELGQATNTATLSSTIGVSTTSNFGYTVVPLLPPWVLKPRLDASSTQAFSTGAAMDPSQVVKPQDEHEVDSAIIILPDTTFEGLARAGSVVTIYEGSPEGCFGDFSGCNPTAILSATVGVDRRWVIRPPQPLETRDYYLYFRAEIDGAASASMFNMWQPVRLRVDERFARAGFDVDNFIIEAGDQEVRPGAIGGRSGTTPNEDITIKFRQKAPDEILTNPAFRAHHDLQIVVHTGDRTITQTLPASRIERVSGTQGQVQQTGNVGAREHFSSWDFIYVQKGFGPGSRVEIWCLPVFYTEEGIPIVALVYVKCHEILIDPAGYVYDRERAGHEIPWPEKPDDQYLIPNATVTVTVRTGDHTFVRWPAEDTGQVNPQVTDITTPDRILVYGYYAFYVPPGQYKVIATAPGCAPFESPILTVVDEPVFYNVGMRCTQSSAGNLRYYTYLPRVASQHQAVGGW